MKKQLSIMIALVVLAIGIITSCKKDPIPNNNEQNNEQPSDTIPSGNDSIPNGNDTIPIVIDGIRFGDTTGMIVTTYNTIMEFDEGRNPIILDLNDGGIDDIKIETYYDGPLAIGEFQTLTLHCLNDHTELLGDSIVKESYSHRETTYDTIDDYIVITHAYTFSTCETIEENDPVNTSKVFEVFANDYDNTFGAEDHFQTGNAVLFRENVKYSLAYPGDEIVDVDYYNNIYDCWNFPTDEEKYIGFRITKNGNSRYGWLKIKLKSWDGKVVDTELIETAIQK
jgi:hypothetical protein